MDNIRVYVIDLWLEISTIFGEDLKPVANIVEVEHINESIGSDYSSNDSVIVWRRHMINRQLVAKVYI